MEFLLIKKSSQQFIAEYIKVNVTLHGWYISIVKNAEDYFLILLCVIRLVEFLWVTLPIEFFLSKLSTDCIYIFPVQNDFTIICG